MTHRIGPIRRAASVAGRGVIARIGTATACAAAIALAGCRSEPAPTASPSPASGTPSTYRAQPTTAPTTAPSADQRTVATVNGLTITQADLYQPLIESYGLTMLQNVMLLKLSKQLADQMHLTVTPADVQAERARMLAGLFNDATPADYPSLLDQFLRTKNLSHVQFDMLVETNTNLRKVVSPHLPVFTEDQMHQAFGRFYGENRIIHDIEVPNMADASEAKRRVAAGEPFEKVAKEMSDDARARELGGELPAFSAQAPNIPKAIKDVAFTMKVGDISDPVQDGSEYHILRLDAIIPPKVVKYEDVKDQVRKALEDSWTRLEIDQLRNQLAQVAIKTIHIDDAALAGQWQQMLDRQNNKQHDRDEIRQELGRETPATAPAPATMPGAAPVAPG